VPPGEGELVALVSGESDWGNRLNFTGVDAAAGAIGAVVSATAATATLYLQWRSTKVAAAAGRRGGLVTPDSSDGLEVPLAANGETGIAADTAETADIRPRPQAAEWHTARRIAIPPLSGIAAGLIVALLAAWLFGNKHPSVQIISPRHGAEVSQQNGFQASGTFSDLGNDTIWLADYDGTGYTVDSEATIKAGSSWTAPDSDLGNSGQALPFPLTARVIVADSQCAKALDGAMNNGQDYLTELPGGCEVAGAITVEVTRR
jgi:hypothetical protein